MSLKQYLAAQREIINNELVRILNETPFVEDVPAELLRAMQYSVLDGGKRLRPILLLESCLSVGGKQDNAIYAACAIEFIHAFSLIHDDLPCMDDDALRRGKPTCHVAFGEATALLAGDALFALAFQVIADSPVSPHLCISASSTLARAAGAMGMIGGQADDMKMTGKRASLSEVQSVHRRKTGALIQASTVIGGVLGGGSEKEIESLKEYGSAVGLAFQIQDDILDVIGNQDEVGKQIGSDQKNLKNTYPVMVGIEKAQAMALSAVENAIAALSGFGSSFDNLREIARYIVERKS